MRSKTLESIQKRIICLFKKVPKRKKINSGRLKYFRSVDLSQQSLAVIFWILSLSSIVSLNNNNNNNYDLFN